MSNNKPNITMWVLRLTPIHAITQCSTRNREKKTPEIRRKLVFFPVLSTLKAKVPDKVTAVPMKPEITSKVKYSSLLDAIA